MKRRHLLAGLAAGAALPAHAQRVPRIGVLMAGDIEPIWSLLTGALAALGYIDGRTVRFERRVATAASGNLDKYAAELVGLNVDVIVPVFTPAVGAAQRATKTIPILFNGAAPEAYGVRNLARPDGNVSGVFNPSPDLAAKNLQLFREIKPGTTSFGFLMNAADPLHVALRASLDKAAQAEKIEFLAMPINGPADLEPAFDQLARRGAGGALVQPTLGFAEPIALSLKHKFPTVSFRREFTEAGGLFSYGGSQGEMLRVLASYIDRVIKGAKVADLPIQQATHFELVLNQKTAKALGIVFPQSFVARADEVIE
jgi:putative ABC transport system substrate-binding protein